MTTPPESHIHRPLPTTAPYIRCLQFLPPRSDGEIRLWLEPQSLEESDGQYDAISYTWGTDEPSHRIWINGKSRLVRSNLWKFLNHYRASNFDLPPLGLWIDALCIDQENIAEKNAQVTQMAKVFRQARRVLVWLGDVSTSSAIAQEYTENFEESWTSYGAGSVHADLTQDELSRLFSNSYWKRVWIVQEIALAREARFIIGPILIYMRSMHKFLRHCGEFNKQAFGTKLDSTADTFFTLLRDEIQAEMTMVFALLVFAGRRGADIRDRIYGASALLRSGKGIPIDYGCQREELCILVLMILAAESSRREEALDMVDIRRLFSTLEISLEDFVFFQCTQTTPSASAVCPSINVRWIAAHRYLSIRHALHTKTCAGNPHISFQDITYCLNTLEHGFESHDKTASHPSVIPRTMASWDALHLPQLFVCEFGIYEGNYQPLIIFVLDEDADVKIVALSDLWYSQEHVSIRTCTIPDSTASRIACSMRGDGSHLVGYLEVRFDGEALSSDVPHRSRSTLMLINILDLLVIHELHVSMCIEAGLSSHDFLIY